MKDIKSMILSDNNMMNLLKIIKTFNLLDCWLYAGTLRNFVWNKLSGIEETFTTDIDIAFFDKSMSLEKTELLEANIKQKYPQYDWELSNQYHMNIYTPNSNKYTDTCDAVAKFPERCTAIAARLDGNDDLELFIPFGEEDIINFLVRPTPYYATDMERLEVYRERVLKKNWREKWSQIHIDLY